MVLLSVLIPTLPQRMRTFYPTLVDELQRQTQERSDIEILGLLDNQITSTGVKRNHLMDMAQGDYVVYIDDDDRISPQYFEKVCDCLLSESPDCLIYRVDMYRDGHYLMDFDVNPEYSVQTLEKRPGAIPKYCLRTYPTHIMPWRRDRVKDIRFPDKSYMEECEWALRATQQCDNFIEIPSVLYYYDKNLQLSESDRFK